MAHDHSRNKDVVVKDYKLYNQHACYNGHEEILSFGFHGKDGIVTIKSKEPIKSLNCESSVEIEIKQNKENIEDMKKKKLNLKPFDLEAAKSGKPVYTRSGKKARIICFDRKFCINNQNYPIVALVNSSEDNEVIISGYTKDGLQNPNEYNKLDLMMLSEKKEGWINIFESAEGRAGYTIYDSKEEALEHRCDIGLAIDTVKIGWEE